MNQMLYRKYGCLEVADWNGDGPLGSATVPVAVFGVSPNTFHPNIKNESAPHLLLFRYIAKKTRNK